jgi:hypothetical protein
MNHTHRLHSADHSGSNWKLPANATKLRRVAAPRPPRLWLMSGASSEAAGPGLAKPAAEAIAVQARAARAKYRVSEEKQRVPPMLIGFHPANRAGSAPSAERCIDLARHILESGFQPELADCSGVLVQSKPGCTLIHSFNVEQLKDCKQMTALVNGTPLTFGSLSHSHLNQIFKNLASELVLGLEQISGKDGRCSLQLLKQVDPEFERYVREGLLWEILDHSINDDPEALDVIQAACNASNTVGMDAHEMECILKLSTLCKRSAVVTARMTSQVCFETVRDKLAATMPGMVADPDFQALFAFVVHLDNGPFLADLKQFAARLLNQKASQFISLGW